MSIEKMSTYTQINSASAGNTQPLSFLKSIIGEGAVYKFLVKLFIGELPTIHKSSVALELAAENADKFDQDGYRSLFPPRNKKRGETHPESEKGADKKGDLRKSALKIVNELLISVKMGPEGTKKNNQVIGKLISDRLENFFKNLECYSPHLSNAEKEALHQLMASRINLARDHIARYKQSPSAKLSDLLLKREEIKQKRDDIGAKFMLANAKLGEKEAALKDLKDQRSFILKSIELLGNNDLLQLEHWEKASASLIRDIIFRLGEVQKELDNARTNADKAEVRTARADIKYLQGLIMRENKEVLEPVRKILQDPIGALNDLQESLIKVEKDITQYKKEQIRPILKLEAQRDAYEVQLEHLTEPLINLIDKEISGGLMGFLEGFESELSLKRSYPDYPLLRTYYTLSSEELESPEAAEMYRDYIESTREELQKIGPKIKRFIFPGELV